jgi:hypothetical protein
MNWKSTQWNQGVKLQKSAGIQFSFGFPAGGLNAIQANRGALAIGKTITITYNIRKTQGNPQFVSLDPAPSPPGLRPNFRPMLQVAHDDYASQDNRWWPTGVNGCAFLPDDLTGTNHTFSIQIVPSLWANVLGKLATQRMNGFRKVINHSGKLNIVFGGGNSFSHGVRIRNGQAQFVLVNLTIQ